MILLVIAAIAGLAVAAILFDFIKSYIETNLTIRRFKKYSNGLPLGEGMGIGGHLTKIFGGDIWKTVDYEHKKNGDFFAQIYVTRTFVSSINLDFIKSLIFDEPQHTNRVDDLGIPMPVVSPDSIMLAQDEKWRRLRKYTAPAFS